MIPTNHQDKMSLFRRPYRFRALLAPIPRKCPFSPAVQVRFASGYGDPSSDAHPATANPQEQGSSTQEKQPEHPGPRENEPSKQGGSSYGDEGQETKSEEGSSKTGGSGNRFLKEERETKLGGSLSQNKDKKPDPPSETGVGGPRVKGDLNTPGETDGEDARDVGGKDDTRKQS